MEDRLMSRWLLVAVVFWSLAATVNAAPLRIDIIYTDGQILSGPLTPDLDALPESVFASFTLSSAAGTLADVVDSSLVFGDGAWSAGDLESFSAAFLPTDAGGLAVVSLSYAYRAIDTPTANGRLSANFPLTIQGTDVASGLEFHYQYDTSSQEVTFIPEPSSVALAALGFAFVLSSAYRWRKRGRT
jgi:hypothetical protein